MLEMTDLREEIESLARRAKEASRGLAGAPTEKKDAVLRRLAAALRGSVGDQALRENKLDMRDGAELSPSLRDRLWLDRERLDGIADALDHVATLPDPVGQVASAHTLDNGLEVSRVRAPLGLVGIIYESRPNVTIDAAALCFKSGNACLLRGGKEAFRSNRALAGAFVDALEVEGFDPSLVSLIPTIDRQATRVMIELEGVVDLVIPRGGEGLIRFVAENARVPVIRHYKGVCHLFVDEAADLHMALRIALNSKAQRPGVCNALETLLVDAAVAEDFLPMLDVAMKEAGVSLHADERALQFVDGTPATAQDWDEEYLELILAVKVVDGFDAALAHIAKHGSLHTEAIITEDQERAARWVREVDASLVLVNASTRFNDGAQLGLGAEVGISTTKLHAYGPMGLAELCCLKWVGRGTGQVRA